jgi:Flp pilus assembly protein TadG
MQSEGESTFLGSEEGNMTVFSVFMTVLILMITGAAVDIMRFEAVRAEMQSTMDRAVLAAADLDQRQDPVDVVNDYMNKAGLAGVMSGVQVEESSTARTVTAWGDGVLDTIFLGMSGFDTLTAPALSSAEERIANVEISMVLDISGSMRFNDRINKLKPAAQAFVDKVMDEDSNGVTTLNLIPFAGHVNPGNTLFNYFRGERPKIKKENNGWGNGDQDAPGNSLCNNNAENAYEGSQDPACLAEGGVFNPDEGHFMTWPQAISNVVYYFDTDGDGVYDRAHKVEGFPESASRDVDDFFKGTVAFLIANNSELTGPETFLGASIKGGNTKSQYFQVKGNENGDNNDLGPTKNQGKIPGKTYSYGSIDFVTWEPSYVSPNYDLAQEIAAAQDAGMPPGQEAKQSINMPGSCVEIHQSEFSNTNMPTSSDYVPHFMYWPIAADVMDWGWCPDEDTAIQYYSDNKEALKQFIGGMRMHDGTGLHYAMKYALSLLDPNTADAVSYLIENGLVAPRFQGRPIAWNDPETEKYIVLMTDGQTTEQVRPTDPRAAINGTVELQNQGGSSWQTLSSKSNNIAHLMQQCGLAKSLGVTVFTIAYETNQAAADDMRECASSESHFFHVTGDEIYDAFDIVARQINNLRLIQ